MMALEIMKRYMGLEQSIRDLFAMPLVLGIAIGRMGARLRKRLRSATHALRREPGAE
jgi:hypothetical protein